MKSEKLANAIGIDGLRQFQDPLDLCQDPATGRIYVAEYKGQKLTLVRPRPNNPDGSPPISFDIAAAATWASCGTMRSRWEYVPSYARSMGTPRIAGARTTV